ncbi:unnamed protein product [Polarella glacialis]|nr:unnamed protein product [Polarella glacialis]
MLNEAPTTATALRLAARLRRAAREERRLKDGRAVSAENVDKAMDAFLEKVSRLRENGFKEDDGEDDEEEESLPASSPFARPAGESRRESGRMPGYDAWTSPENDDDDNGGDYNDQELQELEEEKGEQLPRKPLKIKKFVRSAPTGPMAPGPGGKVSPELWESVIDKKYNNVDRVWQSPTAASLPTAPEKHLDSMLPQDAWLRLPHIAVNGMTNCGKSTLINHAVHWNYAAKASSVAGKTKSIDFYVVNNRFVLVDLPGYPDPEEIAHLGVLKNWERQWEELVLTYLKMCADGKYDLRLLLQLQLTRKRPTKMCQKFVGDCQSLDLPLLMVMTKDDQLKRGHEERIHYVRNIKNILAAPDLAHLHYTCDTEQRSNRSCKKQLHRWMRESVQAESSAEVKQKLKDFGLVIMPTRERAGMPSSKALAEEPLHLTEAEIEEGRVAKAAAEAAAEEAEEAGFNWKEESERQKKLRRVELRRRERVRERGPPPETEPVSRPAPPKEPRKPPPTRAEAKLLAARAEKRDQMAERQKKREQARQARDKLLSPEALAGADVGASE